MSQNYNITITAGNPYSTYNLYYDVISNSNFCLLSLYNTNAVSVPYNDLINGVLVNVPDSAYQIIILDVGDCQSELVIPITPVVPVVEPENLCLSFTVENLTLLNDTSPWTFQPNGSQNGKTKWSSTGITTNNVYDLIWNLTAQQWEIQVNSTTTFFLTLSSEPPLGSWRTTNPIITNISTVSGSCQSEALKITNVVPYNTNCKGTTPCTGKVDISVAGGIPPYQYAVSSTPGNPSTITWSPSNIINGLCEGNVNCVVKDSLGNLSQSQQATISFNEIPKTYTATINKRFQVTTVNTQQPTRKVQGYSEWSFELDQPLDPGVTIKFNLLINDQNITHKPFGEGSLSTVSTLFKNNTLVSPTSTTTDSIQATDTFCVGGTKITDVTGNTYTLTYTSGDIISGTTNTSLEITFLASEFGCYTLYEGFANALISPDPVTPITGCQCCSLQATKSTALISLNTN